MVEVTPKCECVKGLGKVVYCLVEIISKNKLVEGRGEGVEGIWGREGEGRVRGLGLAKYDVGKRKSSSSLPAGEEAARARGACRITNEARRGFSGEVVSLGSSDVGSDSHREERRRAK